MKKEGILLIVYSCFVTIFSLWFFIFQFTPNITGYSINSYDNYNVYVINNYEGESVNFVIPIENIENFDSEYYATIEILDNLGKSVYLTQTERKEITKNSTSELKVLWPKAESAGNYQARINVNIGNNSYSFTKSFIVEQKTLTFESISINEFNLGEVVNFSVIVQNHLNENVKDAFIGILIYDTNNSIIGNLKSEKEDISPNSIKKLIIYWDTKNIMPGKYNAKLNMNYGSKIIDKDIVLNIAEDNMEVVGIGYSIVQKPKQSNNNFIIIFLVIILVIVNLFWILFYFRAKHKNKKLDT